MTRNALAPYLTDMGGYEPEQVPEQYIQPELRAYKPTWRDTLASWLMPDERASPEQSRLVEGLTGSRGLGNTGMGLVDFVPGVGNAFQAQEEGRKGEHANMAFAMAGGPAAKLPKGAPHPPNALSPPAFGSQAKAARPEPDGLLPKTEAMGPSQVLAETGESLAPTYPHDQAVQAAEALRQRFGREFDVMAGGSAAGKSAYVRTPFGDLRFSDHAAGFRPGQAWDFYGQPASADDVVRWYEGAQSRSADAAAAAQAAQAAERETRLAASAPQRASDAANRAAKEAFWRENGLEQSTETAKDKAWKQYRRGQWPSANAISPPAGITAYHGSPHDAAVEEYLLEMLKRGQ
jgi:hypothetical protein